MATNANAHIADRTQRQAISESRTDRRRSLDALHQLEWSAAGAASGRESDWTADVRHALSILEGALLAQRQHAGESTSPLSDIEAQEPRLRNRVLQLRQRYGDLERRVVELRPRLAAGDPHGDDVADIRRQLQDIAAELRYLQAREADLVYEAYAVDLGAGD